MTFEEQVNNCLLFIRTNKNLGLAILPANSVKLNCCERIEFPGRLGELQAVLDIPVGILHRYTKPVWMAAYTKLIYSALARKEEEIEA